MMPRATPMALAAAILALAACTATNDDTGFQGARQAPPGAGGEGGAGGGAVEGAGGAPGEGGALGGEPGGDGGAGGDEGADAGPDADGGADAAPATDAGQAGPDLTDPAIRAACERLVERLFNRCGYVLAIEDCPFQWPPSNPSGCIDGEMDKTICNGGPVEVPNKPYCVPDQPFGDLTEVDVACMQLEATCAFSAHQNGCPFRECWPNDWRTCVESWRCHREDDDPEHACSCPAR